MRRLESQARVERLVDSAIARFALDLTGTVVLTETASGPFVMTPLIAARAGASVIAVTRDSRFGTADDVRRYTADWSARLGVADRVTTHVGQGAERAGEAALITNLGFVRPIDDAFLARTHPGAVVSLMCEPWEVRSEDVDVAACRRHGIPVLGTDERDPRLQTFGFVGMLALKLLLELEVEVMLSRVLVVSSEPFASPIAALLRAAGADVITLDVTVGADLRAAALTEILPELDAVVVAEHRDRRPVVGGESGLTVDALVDGGAVLAHIAGVVEDPDGRLRKHPSGPVAPGWMSVTTDALGPRPVIDLHAAGLRVGQALLEAASEAAGIAQIERLALARSDGLAQAPQPS